jgi:hypothetical protein
MLKIDVGRCSRDSAADVTMRDRDQELAFPM